MSFSKQDRFFNHGANEKERGKENQQGNKGRKKRDSKRKKGKGKKASTTSSSRGETKSNHGNSKRDDLLRLPDDVIIHEVFTYFNFKDYALTGCASQYAQAHWQTANRRKPMPLYVPEDCKTLEEAVKRVAQDPRIMGIVLGKGDHVVEEVFTDEYDSNKNLQNTLVISSAMSIVGRPDVPKEEIVVVGGIHFKKGIQGNCHLQHLTLRRAKGNGVAGLSSFTMDDVLVKQCGYYGVLAYGTAGVVGRCTNVEVRQCEWSGVVAQCGAYITLIGAKTTVHHNCTRESSDDYGLTVWGSSSSTIQLVSPLTKEQVSIDNGGGGNWGANDDADIHQIKTLTEAEIKVAVAARARGEVRVPEDCTTLQGAVDWVHKEDRLTTIVVGKGMHHQSDDDHFKIASAMNIVGDPGVPKSEIVVVGGVKFEEGIQGICHLQHLTLRQAMLSGVYGKSSFTMEDVLVEQCGTFGVVVDGTGVLGRCTNVEVYHCGRSGVVAFDGASITLIGAKTTVHHNCTDRDYSGEYGLVVAGTSSSAIQLFSPLTKEQVSIDNGGGGNWGALYGGDINQIKTI